MHFNLIIPILILTLVSACSDDEKATQNSKVQNSNALIEKETLAPNVETLRPEKSNSHIVNEVTVEPKSHKENGTSSIEIDASIDVAKAVDKPSDLPSNKEAQEKKDANVATIDPPSKSQTKISAPIIESIESVETNSEIGEQSVNSTAVESQPITVDKSGTWIKKSQKIQGTWNILSRDGDTYLVLNEGFKTRNAPDLKFVLSRQSIANVNNRNAMDGVLIIANLRSNSGAQEYKLPSNFDDYSTLLLHCEKYTKLWGAADIR